MNQRKKNNEIVSLSKDSIEHIHRGSEDSQMIELVVPCYKYENKSFPHTISTATSVSNSNINNEMAECFVNSKSIITNEQRSPEVEEDNPKMNLMQVRLCILVFRQRMVW